MGTAHQEASSSLEPGKQGQAHKPKRCSHRMTLSCRETPERQAFSVRRGCLSPSTHLPLLARRLVTGRRPPRPHSLVLRTRGLGGGSAGTVGSQAGPRGENPLLSSRKQSLRAASQSRSEGRTGPQTRPLSANTVGHGVREGRERGAVPLLVILVPVSCLPHILNLTCSRVCALFAPIPEQAPTPDLPRVPEAPTFVCSKADSRI